MEPELARVREEEPAVQEAEHERHEKRFLRFEDARSKIAALPRVLRYEEIPWRQNQQARVKHFVGSLFLDEFLDKGPIYTVGASEQVVAPGSKSGTHRHFEEAIFYVLEGEGWEHHDGVDYPWSAGDLFCVPSYAIHQHNTNANTPARIFFCVSPVWSSFGLGEQFVEFHDLHPSFNIPRGAEPLRDEQGKLLGYRRADGVEIHHQFNNTEMANFMEAKWDAADTPVQTPANRYDQYVNAWTEEATWRKHCPHVVKASEQPWEETRMGRIKWLAHHSIPSALKTFEAFVQEIPPGGSSGTHRHVAEEVIKVVDGNGYLIIDHESYEWHRDDVMLLPMFSTHQFVNRDRERPALLYSVRTTFYDFAGHSGIQHLEDASGG